MRVSVVTDLTSGTSVEIHCSVVNKDVERLENYIRRFDERLPGQLDGATVNIPLEEVLFIESVDKKTFIYTKDNVLLTEKRLYELEEILDERDFFRCSKSMIVHLNKITKLKPEVTRNIRATLENGEVIVISRRYVPALKNLIGLEG